MVGQVGTDCHFTPEEQGLTEGDYWATQSPNSEGTGTRGTCPQSLRWKLEDMLGVEQGGLVPRGRGGPCWGGTTETTVTLHLTDLWQSRKRKLPERDYVASGFPPAGIWEWAGAAGGSQPLAGPKASPGAPGGGWAWRVPGRWAETLAGLAGDWGPGEGPSAAVKC